MANEWIMESAGPEGIRRIPISRQLSVGRSRSCDIIVDDPYVSRVHCTVEPVQGGLRVVAVSPLNPIVVRGQEHSETTLASGSSFAIGNSLLRVLSAGAVSDAPTLKLTRRLSGSQYILRPSTRELVHPDGTLVAQFSAAEYAAFAALVRKHPDAASHYELGRAVWGDVGFDQYQLHRLLQRIRQRLGDAGTILENVRGAGYRVTATIDVL